MNVLLKLNRKSYPEYPLKTMPYLMRPAQLMPVLLLALGWLIPHEVHADKPRLMVLTDIGGDPDDQQSMIRLMCYAHAFEIEGLLATGSGNPRKPETHRTNPKYIREIVQAYGKVWPSLRRHKADFPDPAHLLALIKTGSSIRGRAGIGNQKDTEASAWIMQATDKTDSRPLNIAIWGGQTDLAQALWRVRQDRGLKGLQTFIARLRVYDIADQDQLVDWLSTEFPNLFYVLTNAQPGQDRREATFRGMYLGGDESLTSLAWLDQHARKNHGSLGALYPTSTWTAPNPHGNLKEGDTPSWFYFLPLGLNDPAHPDWGGWGGRFQKTGATKWRDAPDSIGTKSHVRNAVWRWRPSFQADFQARMDWCVKPFAEANHAPVAVINQDSTTSVMRPAFQPGVPFQLDASLSRDPDQDSLSFHWWVYDDPSKGFDLDRIRIQPSANAPTVQITLPPATEPHAAAHIILEVRDHGTPALTSYRRVVFAK